MSGNPDPYPIGHIHTTGPVVQMQQRDQAHPMTAERLEEIKAILAARDAQAKGNPTRAQLELLNANQPHALMDELVSALEAERLKSNQGES